MSDEIPSNPVAPEPGNPAPAAAAPAAAATAVPKAAPPQPPILNAVEPALGKSVEEPAKPSLSRFLGDAFGLLKGMNITFRYFRKPSRVVTREYPENRETLKFPLEGIMPCG